MTKPSVRQNRANVVRILIKLGGDDKWIKFEEMSAEFNKLGINPRTMISATTSLVEDGLIESRKYEKKFIYRGRNRVDICHEYHMGYRGNKMITRVRREIENETE